MHGAIWCGISGCSTLALPFATPLPSAAAAASAAMPCPCYTGFAARRRPLGAVFRGPHRQTPRRDGGAVGNNDSRAGWNHCTSGHWAERASAIVVAALSSRWRPTLRRVTSAYTDPHGGSDVPGLLTHGSLVIQKWMGRPAPSIRSRCVLGAQLIGMMDVIVGSSGGRGGGTSSRRGIRCAARRSSRSTAPSANDIKIRVGRGGSGGGDCDLEGNGNNTGYRDKVNRVSVDKRRTTSRANDAAAAAIGDDSDSDELTASTDTEDGASGPRIQPNRRKFVDALSITTAPARGSAKLPTADLPYTSTTEAAGMIETIGGDAIESASSRGAARRGRTRTAATAASATTAATALSATSASVGGRSREGAYEGTGGRPEEGAPSRRAGVVRRSAMAVGNVYSDIGDTDIPRGNSSTHKSAFDNVGVLIPMDEIGRGFDREGAGRGRRARVTRGSVGAVHSSSSANGSGTEVQSIGAGLSGEQEELVVVPSGTATATLMPSNGSNSFTAAVSTATPMAAMAEVATTSQEIPQSTTRSTGRGRALTGLRTIIGRPGQRRGTGSSSNSSSSSSSSNNKTDDRQTDAAAAAAITAFAGQVARDGLTGGTANIAAAKFGTTAVAAAAAIAPPASAPASSAATHDTTADGGKPVSGRTETDDVAPAAAAAAATSAEVELLESNPADNVGSSRGINDSSSRRQMSAQEREARLRELFASVDGGDETSATRSCMRRLAAAAAGAAAATSSTAASSSAVSTAAAAASSFDVRDGLFGAESTTCQQNRDALPAGSDGRYGTSDTASYGSGAHWDEQLLVDEFAGMVDIMDFGADYDKAIKQPVGNLTTATAAVRALATAGDDGAAATAAVSTSTHPGASTSSDVVHGSNRLSLGHDLAMGSVWLDGDVSSGDEGGHHVTRFVEDITNTTNTSTSRGGDGGSGGSYSRRAPSRAPSEPTPRPPSPAAEQTETTYQSSMVSVAESSFSAAEAAGEADPQPPASFPPPAEWRFSDDLDGFLGFTAGSSGSWRDDGGGGGGGGGRASAFTGTSSNSSATPAAFASGPASSIAVGSSGSGGGVAPLPYNVDEDDLFGFDFSYVAPVAAQAPLQLLAAAAPPRPLPSRWGPHHQAPAPAPAPAPDRQLRTHRYDGNSRGPGGASTSAAETARRTNAAAAAAEVDDIIAATPEPDRIRTRHSEARHRNPLPVQDPDHGRYEVQNSKSSFVWERERGGPERRRTAAGVTEAVAGAQVRFRKVTHGSSLPVSLATDATAAVANADRAVVGEADATAAVDIPEGDWTTPGGSAVVGSSTSPLGPATARRLSSGADRNGGKSGTNVIPRSTVRIGSSISESGPSNSSSYSNSNRNGTGGIGGSSNSVAALLVQELLAPMRGAAHQNTTNDRRGSSSSSSDGADGRGGDESRSRGGRGGSLDGSPAAAAAVTTTTTEFKDTGIAGGRRGGGYLTSIQDKPAAPQLQLQLQPDGAAKPSAPPGGWKPRGTSETTLFVKGLDPSQGEERLREALAQLFSSAGRIVQIRLPCDSRRTPKGIAYIVFESPEEKARAVSMDGSRLLGRVIRVDANVDRPA
ncbi:hypothetical protein VaNZ11_006709 [Volvox africanus]|uniref:RRM domain-containing protein n=1 Tax=Volvox africanus TaxID=51714 RepID=A0ABQ5S1Z0_9CHLO|nr:hypothetical protein VaNZ11_006709 [Volvox africanus]